MVVVLGRLAVRHLTDCRPRHQDGVSRQERKENQGEKSHQSTFYILTSVVKGVEMSVLTFNWNFMSISGQYLLRHKVLYSFKKHISDQLTLKSSK